MTHKSKVEPSRLRAFELFTALKDEELAEIAQFCEEVTVQPETILIRQGQVGSEIYFLEKGSVTVYRGEGDTYQFLAVLQAPTLLGERALLDTERIRTASVKALTTLRVLTFQINIFVLFLRSYPSLREKLRQLAEQRR